tara:strand:- start:1429 stop:1677 length:249 start_codon:yes stop_codon:yes gene_type:complete
LCIHRAYYLCSITDPRKPAGHLNNSEKRTNKWLAKHQAKVEHSFRVIKCQFGFTKVRYRELVKNTAQLKNLFCIVQCLDGTA